MNISERVEKFFVNFTLYFEFLLSILLKCLYVIKASAAEEFHEVIGTELRICFNPQHIGWWSTRIMQGWL